MRRFMNSPAGDGENVRRGGFTLIEIMVVVAIIVVLAGILMAVGAGVIRTSAINATKATLKSLDAAMSVYLKDHPEPGMNYSGIPAPFPIPNNDWVTKLYAFPDTAKMLDSLKPSGVGSNLAILDGFGRPIYYIPSNVDLTVIGTPGVLTLAAINQHTPGRFVSFGPDRKPDSVALGATASTSAAGDDIFSDGATAGP